MTTSEALERELEAPRGGDDHLWLDVECPTCGSSPYTHCAGDPAERPGFQRNGVTGRDGETVYADRPCAKRVIAGVLEMMKDDD